MNSTCISLHLSNGPTCVANDAVLALKSLIRAVGPTGPEEADRDIFMTTHISAAGNLVTVVLAIFDRNYGKDELVNV